MDNDFAKKVRDAAIAGWWTVAISTAFLSISWFAYLAILSARPSWMLALWGQDMSWSTVQGVGLWAMAVFRICLYVMVAVVVWLSLWARRLGRK